MRNANHVTVPPVEGALSSNVVDVHIKSLWKKLQDNAIIPRYIATVRGAGYRLEDG